MAGSSGSSRASALDCMDAGKSAELSKAPTFKGVSLSLLKDVGNR
jgi:hypothetical protein